jgi:uncharacterized protein (DUF4415 family)
MSEKTTKITRCSWDEIGKGNTDWEAFDRLTDAEIAADAAADPDVAPIADRAWFEGASLVLPEPKQAVSLRIDSDVLRWFRDSGPGYQSRMNAVLREYASAHGAPVVGRSARTPRRKTG